jgi:hypothetical protein
MEKQLGKSGNDAVYGSLLSAQAEAAIPTKR